VQPNSKKTSAKSFVILGHHLDPHAHYVSWALGAAGYQTTFVNSWHDNCPTGTTLYIDQSVDDFSSAEWDNADAVWYRRLAAPPDKEEGDGDEFTAVEDRRFTKWLIGMQEDRPIRWINRPSAAQAAENKFRQLKFARLHGLRIPRTLVTAQPDRFRAFLKKEGVVVAKALDAFSWELESGETLAAFATVLDLARGSQLSDEDIAQCVTVYQQRINKVADVRMVVMGTDVYAFKVLQLREQHFDFRIGFYQPNQLRYEEIPVPTAVQQRIVGLMSSLGINFTSADFAVQADGEWVFLDLNPNGQWLFVEEGCPESRLGQKFCSFFANTREPGAAETLFPSFAQYVESDAARAMREECLRCSSAQAPSATSRKESHG
jgi:hypothetical protein